MVVAIVLIIIPTLLTCNIQTVEYFEGIEI